MPLKQETTKRGHLAAELLAPAIYNSPEDAGAAGDNPAAAGDIACRTSCRSTWEQSRTADCLARSNAGSVTATEVLVSQDKF